MCPLQIACFFRIKTHNRFSLPSRKNTVHIHFWETEAFVINDCKSLIKAQHRWIDLSCKLPKLDICTAPLTLMMLHQTVPWPKENSHSSSLLPNVVFGIYEAPWAMKCAAAVALLDFSLSCPDFVSNYIQTLHGIHLSAVSFAEGASKNSQKARMTYTYFSEHPLITSAVCLLTQRNQRRVFNPSEAS